MIRWIKEKIQKYKDNNTKFGMVDAQFCCGMLNVYLCGPIGKTYTDWRAKFKDTDKIHFVNPEYWNYTYFNDLCEADLYAIRKADAVFAYVPLYSPGTAMELFYSRRLNKPLFASVLKKYESPWYSYAVNEGHNRFLFHNLRDAKKAMTDYFDAK